MSSLFEQYCDVTESMAFKSSQLYASSSFNTSNPKLMIYQRLKCFNCFGIPDKQQFCSQCGGTNFVTDNHPLALLFNEVFQRKLGKNAPSKESVWGEFQNVDTITEQQEQLDERKILCDVCNKQCDINYKYFCQCCQCFFVCQKCADQRGDQINHPHPLATNKKLYNGLPLFKRTSSSNYGSNKKSQLNSPESKNQKRNNLNEQKSNLQFFNVCDIIEKQISHTYGNVAQNNSCDPSESISGPEFGIMQSLEPYKFKLLELQGSDKGFKPTRQSSRQEENLTKSVNPPSNSYYIGDACFKQRQSIDFNIIMGKDQIRKSIDGRQSFGFDYENYIQQHCNNCGAQLKDVYTICKSCQKNGQNYKICCQCDDKKLFTHEKNHFLEMRLGNLLGRTSQMVSKKLIDSQDQQIQSPKLTKKRSSLEQRPPRLDQTPFDETLSANKSFSKLKSSGSLGMSVQFNKQKQSAKPKVFGEQSIVNLDCQGLFNSTDLSQQIETIRLVHKKSSLCEVNNSMEDIPHPSRFNHGKNKPKVAFAQIGSDEENIKIAFVQSDSDHQDIHHFQSHKYEQVTIKSSRSSYKGFKSVKSMIFSKNQDHTMVSQSHEVHKTFEYSQSSIKYNHKSFEHQYQSQITEENVKVKQKVEYIFHQYCCDQCGCNPIKNVRYHCLQCEDFDVCQNCYGVALKYKHNHKFQKIDGLKKLQDKKNMMLQKKDLNKGKDSLLRNSNIGLLAKSKKTVDLLKRNVQQLGGAISNLDKSYSSNNDFFSQKFSFKTKVQYC